MQKVLFIDCCMRREKSRSKKLADCFLNSLEEKGKFEIETLSLMDEGMSYLSEGFFQQRDVLLTDKNLQHPRFRYAHQFAAADKIVIAAPFWDLSFPALLKVYIENICVEGITFGCNEKGCFGICKADHMLFLTTRGGFYEGTALEMGSKYLEAMSTFFGIQAFSCIAAEGMDIGLRPAEVILEEAMEKAKEAAKTF